MPRRIHAKRAEAGLMVIWNVSELRRLAPPGRFMRIQKGSTVREVFVGEHETMGSVMAGV